MTDATSTCHISTSSSTAASPTITTSSTVISAINTHATTSDTRTTHSIIVSGNTSASIVQSVINSTSIGPATSDSTTTNSTTSGLTTIGSTTTSPITTDQTTTESTTTDTNVSAARTTNLRTTALSVIDQTESTDPTINIHNTSCCSSDGSSMNNRPRVTGPITTGPRCSRPNISGPTLNGPTLEDSSLEEPSPPQYQTSPGRWRLKTCCLRFSLRTGCTIISIWSMNEALLFMIGASSLLYQFYKARMLPPCNSMNDTAVAITNTTTITINHNGKPCYNGHHPWSKDAPPNPELSFHFTVAAVFVFLVMCIYFLLSALMLYGIKNRKPTLLKPWLWWGIGEMFATFHHFALFERSISIVIKIYSCFIVYSYIEELQEEHRQNDVVSYMTLRSTNIGRGGVSGRSRVVGGRSGGLSMSSAAEAGRVSAGGEGGGGGRSLLTVSRFPTESLMTHEELAAKIDAARLLSPAPPPPYCFIEHEGSGGSGSAMSEAGTATSMRGASINPPRFEGATALPQPASSSNNHFIQLMPPPSYEEATRDEMVYLPQFSRHLQREDDNVQQEISSERQVQQEQPNESNHQQGDQQQVAQHSERQQASQQPRNNSDNIEHVTTVQTRYC